MGDEMKTLSRVPVLLLLGLAACAQDPNLPVTQISASDPDYARAALSSAVKPAGEGGVSEGQVVRVTEDIPVYRLWSGPASRDANGRTNRVGSWWTPGTPHGSSAQYRVDYEICHAWNALTWVARCTLKKGAVVAIGPGQSVSAQTCQDPSGQEHYPADPAHWQIYVDKVWARPQEVVCEPESEDYQADPEDVSRQK
jgi:hypothetical protein